jgi:homoserine dehydrogenase
MSRARSSAIASVESITEPVAVDSYRTSGTSPGGKSFDRRQSGSSTVHLLGPGAVGCAVLTRIARSRRRLVAVTDSTATVHDPDGLDPLAIRDWKKAGHSLVNFTGARALNVRTALDLALADVVIDTSSSDFGRDGWTSALSSVLARGARLALAAKAALADAAAEWLSGDYAENVGCNAVLGGTGLNFTRELPVLRRRWQSVAIVGNASTTTIIAAIEQGASLAEGIDAAARLGFLETDPELDLRGADAAVKLAIVASVLTGRRITPDAVLCDDIRNIDLRQVRVRPRRGNTTRLVARLTREGQCRVAYEELPADSVLAARAGQVVYDYQLTSNERRLHIGGGIGPDATAEAVWTDVQSQLSSSAARLLAAAGAR